MKTTLSFAFLLTTGAATAQTAAVHWTGSFTSDRSFIENRGQFDGLGVAGVGFAVDEGAVRILFAPDAVGFHLHDKERNQYRKPGERDKPRTIVRKDMALMRWEGSNAVRIAASGKRDDHNAYAYQNADGSTSDRTGIAGFAQLRYEGLYPGIDAVYTIHPETGIKYALHLRPGADAGLIHMRWDDAHRTRLGPEGELRIATTFGEIVDHAPIAHYADGRKEPIGVRFTLKDGVAGFALDAHEAARAVVIDPWTVTPSFPNTNRIWDVEVDDASNVYIYGGDSPLRLRKYDPTGALQWTYTTAWDTANYWLGSMITHPSGDCFITAGTDPRIARISTAGAQVWSANGGIFDEYWRMAFNCDNTRLMLGGTRLTLGPTLFPIGYGRAFEMSMANGSVIASVNVAATSPSFLINNPNEIRALTRSANGRYYFMTLDTIGALNQDLTIPYRANNSYGFSYRVAGYGPTNMGINGIAATADHIYTQNGSTLHKRDILTGAIIATAAIPGGNTSTTLGASNAENSGLALDSCGYVYVGSGNGVYKFSPTLVLEGSVTTPGAVYDVAVNHNGEVVACGNGFLTSISIGSCAPPVVECLVCLELAGPGVLCPNDAPVTLQTTLPGGTWSGAGITDAVAGIFDPAAAGPGVHTITYTLTTAAPCGVTTLSVVVSPCAPLSVCQDPDGTLTAANGVGPYTWQHQTTSQDCSACIIACIFPPGCAVNVTAWTTWATGGTVAAAPNYPIQVIDATGTIITIAALADIPACAPCPTIAVQVTDQVNVLCNGASTGSATVQASGGTAPYSYAWSPGGNGATQTGLAADSYSVTATDAEGCTGTTTVLITQPTPLIASIAGTTPVTCAGNDGTATASGSGGTGTLSYAWSPIGGNAATATGLSAGSYTVTVTDANGCTAQATAVIGTIAGPTIQGVSTTLSGCDASTGSITVNAMGTGLQYSIDGGTTNQASATFAGLGAGTYFVTVTDGNGCTAQATAVVGTTAGPTIQGVSTTLSGCDASTGSITVNATGTGLQYSIDGGTTNQASSTFTGVGVGTYIVTVTDADGCIVTISATVTNPPAPLPVITGPAFGCGGDDLLLSTTQPFASYNWQPGGSAATQAVTASGSYIVTVTDVNGCSGSSAPFAVQIESPQAAFGAVPPSPQQPGTAVVFSDGSSAGGGSIISWSWEFGASGANGAGTPASWTFTDAGVYDIMLVITTANGCLDTAWTSYLIRPLDIEIPNVITPNGDQMNEFFVIRNIEYFSNELVIFNRWGMVVHETRNYRNTWRGEDQPDGTYYYALKLDDGREFTGHLTLVR